MTRQRRFPDLHLLSRRLLLVLPIRRWLDPLLDISLIGRSILLFRAVEDSLSLLVENVDVLRRGFLEVLMRVRGQDSNELENVLVKREEEKRWG